MTEAPSVEDVNAAADTALALERARGVPIGKTRELEGVYKIGFSAGALWVIQYLQEHQ